MPVAELVVDPKTGARIELVQSLYREKDLIKLVPGSRYDRDKEVWWFPPSWAACLGLRGVFKHELQVGPALIEWSQNLYQREIEPAMRYRDLLEWDGWEQTPYQDLLAPLMPPQRSGVRFLGVVGGGFLADEMGTGKTAIACAWLEMMQRAKGDALPALVVCTNSMRRTWAEDELPRWAPGLRVELLPKAPKLRAAVIDRVILGETDVIVTNWESLRSLSRLSSYGSVRLKKCVECGGTDPAVKATACQKHQKVLNRVSWGTVIADESHKAKDAKSQQTRALKAVASSAQYRLAMTGTPVANNPSDAWSQLNFLNPGEFPSKVAFVDRFCLISWNSFGGHDIVGISPATREEFFKIFDRFFIRRPKSIILPNLPPKSYSRRVVQMPTKQKKAYDSLRKNMLAELDSGNLAVSNNLTKALRLLQFANATCDLTYAEVPCKKCNTTGKDDGVECQGCNGTGKRLKENVVMTDPSCKVDGLLEVVDEAGGEPMVVFSESKQLILLVKKRLDRDNAKRPKDQKPLVYVSCTGDEPEAERHRNVKFFQEGKADLLLATFGAGGEGLTFTRASTMVILDRSYSLIKNSQGEDRIHRKGQEGDKVTIIDIVTEGTVEDDKQLQVAAKEGRFQELVRDQETFRRLLGG